MIKATKATKVTKVTKATKATKVAKAIKAIKANRMSKAIEANDESNNYSVLFELFWYASSAMPLNIPAKNGTCTKIWIFNFKRPS